MEYIKGDIIDYCSDITICEKEMTVSSTLFPQRLRDDVTHKPSHRISQHEYRNISYNMFDDLILFLRLNLDDKIKKYQDDYNKFENQLFSIFKCIDLNDANSLKLAREKLFNTYFKQVIYSLYDIHPFLSIHINQFILDDLVTTYLQKYYFEDKDKDFPYLDNDTINQRISAFQEEYKFLYIFIGFTTNSYIWNDIPQKIRNWFDNSKYKYQTKPLSQFDQFKQLQQFISESLNLLIVLELFEKDLTVKENYIFSESSFKETYFKVKQTASSTDDTSGLYYLHKLISTLKQNNHNNILYPKDKLKEIYEKSQDTHYHIESFIELILLEFHKLLSSNTSVRTCENCHNFFIPKRSNNIYCNFKYKDTGKECNKIGPATKHKNTISERKKLYKQVTNRINQSLSRAKKDDYQTNIKKYTSLKNKWGDYSNHLEQQLLSEKITEDKYIEAVNKFINDNF